MTNATVAINGAHIHRNLTMQNFSKLPSALIPYRLLTVFRASTSSLPVVVRAPTILRDAAQSPHSPATSTATFTPAVASPVSAFAIPVPPDGVAAQRRARAEVSLTPPNSRGPRRTVAQPPAQDSPTRGRPPAPFPASSSTAAPPTPSHQTVLVAFSSYPVSYPR